MSPKNPDDEVGKASGAYFSSYRPQPYQICVIVELQQKILSQHRLESVKKS